MGDTAISDIDQQVGKPPQTPPQQPPSDNIDALYKTVSRDYDLGDPTDFRKKMQDPANRTAFYKTVSGEYDLGSPDEFEKKIAPPPAPDHLLQHTSVTDARYLGQQAAINPESAPSAGPAPTTTLDQTDPEFAAKRKGLQNQYASKISDIAGQWGEAPSDVMKVMNDFPGENDENHLKANLKMMKENPVAYGRFKAADSNMKTIGAVNVHAANQYNSLQDTPNGSIDQLENNIQGQKDIINSTLSGSQRDQAMGNLQANRQSSFNALNPELQQNASTDPSGAGLDAYQYAGLETLKNFDPVKYSNYVKYLQPGVADSRDPEAKIYLEKVKKDLLDIGTKNTLDYLQEHQGILNTQYQAAQTDQEKEALVSQWNDNKNKIQGIITQTQNEGTRFPYLTDLEFENKAKELRGTADNNVISYALNRFGSGIEKGVSAIEDAAIGMFGSDDLNTYRQMEAGGEAEKDRVKNFLPESDRDPSVISYKFDPQLTDAAKTIKKDPDLTDDQKDQKLITLVKSNPDKIQTITNPQNFGKTANFFSKATLYKSAGMMGDLAAIAVTQAGMEGLGIPKLIAAAAPMFLATEHDFYKEGVEEGVANPSQYAAVHSAIMMAAGMVNPDYNIVKRSLGLGSDLSKTLAGVSEKTWNDVISNNTPTLNRIKNSFTSTAKEAAKMGAVYGAGTSIAGDIANKTIFNQPISGDDMLNHAVKSTKDILMSAVPLLGLGAVFNTHSVSPEEKGRLWDLGENQKLNTERIDNLVQTGQITSAVGDQRKQVIKNVADLINKVPTEDAKGKPLSDQSRADFLYNLIIKKNVTDAKSNVAELHAKRLQDRTDAANMYNTQIIAPELSQKAIETGLANVKIPNNSPFKTSEGNGQSLLHQIQDHVTGRSGEDIGQPLSDTRNIKELFPSYLIDAAIRLLPDSEKQKISDIHDQADIEGKYRFPDELKDQLRTPKINDDALQIESPSSVLQHPQSGVGEEGSERPGVEPSEQRQETARTLSEENQGQGPKVIMPAENKPPRVVTMGVESELHNWLSGGSKMAPEDIEFLHDNFDTYETDIRATPTGVEGQANEPATGTAKPEDKTTGSETGQTPGSTNASGAEPAGSDRAGTTGSLDDNGSARLTIERDKRIAEETKPSIKTESISMKDLARAKDEPEALGKHRDIQQRFSELKKIADCLWD